LETINTPTRWNLNNLQDGLDLEKFKKHVNSIKENLIELELDVTSNNLSEKELLTLSKLIKQIESAESFYYCLTTENIDSSFLTSLSASISTLKSQVRLFISNVQETLSKMTDKQFDDWSNSISQKGFVTELLKDGIKRESSQEKIVSNFSREALSGLEDVYVQLRNNLKVKIVPNDGEKDEISFAEANNLAMSHPEYSKRLRIFKELNRTLGTQSNVFASIYNLMVGTRLNGNKIRKVDYLEESLELNGISKPTLNTMWDVVDANLDKLSNFLKTKAKEMGKEKLSWHELMTPTSICLSLLRRQL
jgi:oligoendopeptidase F